MFLSDFDGLKEIGIDNLEKIFVHTDENVYTDRLNEKKNSAEIQGRRCNLIGTRDSGRLSKEQSFLSFPL